MYTFCYGGPSWEGAGDEAIALSFQTEMSTIIMLGEHLHGAECICTEHLHQRICSDGTYPLADLFPWNIFTTEQICYDTGLYPPLTNEKKLTETKQSVVTLLIKS